MAVENHYGRGGLRERIFGALQQEGKDLDHLTEADLAPVDEFHTRGRAASNELLGAAGFVAGARVLDIGSGIGGPTRRLAREGFQVVGIDLTPEYVELARELTQRSGLEAEFHVGNALATPFADHSFDGVWLQHVNMNIADKAGLFREVARVLRPGGKLAMHEIVAGAHGEPTLPTPWATDPACSHLATAGGLRAAIEKAGLEVLSWRDDTEATIGFFDDVFARMAGGTMPKVGLHLIFGPDMPAYMKNLAMSLREGRGAVIQAVAVKP